MVWMAVALRLVVNEGREVTNQMSREMSGISRPAAARDLRKPVETNWIQEIGKGRSLRYTAK
jgi:Fic family protein